MVKELLFDILDLPKDKSKYDFLLRKFAYLKKRRTFALTKVMKGGSAMNALQLNAELYRNLGIIAEDETMLTKVAKYVRKLAKQITDDPTAMSKEEFFARVDEASARAARGEGRLFTNQAEMNAWLNSL